MKKIIMSVVTVVFAFGVLAAGSGNGFEHCQVGPYDTATPDEPGSTAVYFTAVDDEDEDYVSINAYAGDSYDGSYGFPTGFSGVGEKCLQFKTRFGCPLVRSINPVENGRVGVAWPLEDDLWLDMLLMPTALDEQPDWTRMTKRQNAVSQASGEVGITLGRGVIPDGKLIVHRPMGAILNIDDKMQLFYFEDEEGEHVDLYAQAGHLNSFGQVPTLEIYRLTGKGVPVKRDDYGYPKADIWQRVTIRAVKDITQSGLGIAGFQIFINGLPVFADKLPVSEACIAAAGNSLSAEVKSQLLAGAFFPAYGWGEVPQSQISFFGFDGTGKIDDLSVSTSAPEFWKAHKVTFDLGEHGKRIGGGELEQLVRHGFAATAPEVVSDNGSRFIGWFTAVEGGTKVEDLTVTESGKSFYAHWTGILNVTVRQRYPWNGLVDIAVTVQGTAEDMTITEYTFVATNGVTTAAIPIEHITSTGTDSVSDGVWTRRYVWDAKADVGTVKIDDVALTVNVKPLGVQLWENGPYWAECNVGATKPEENGYYFWWGDTVGHKRLGDSWDTIDGVETKFSFCAENCPTYNKDNFQLQEEGYIDSLGNLNASHDAATVYHGAPWRMPTEAEVTELIKNCTTTWVTTNGVSGRLVEGNGACKQNRIFLPAAGGGFGTDLENMGSFGLMWSSSPNLVDSTYALRLNFYSDHFRWNYGWRYSGLTVRPVREFSQSDVAIGGVTTHLSLDNRAHVIRYVDETGTIQECRNFEIVDDTTRVLTNGFYALWIPYVELTNVVVNGDVKLVLSDECVLSVEGTQNHAAISVCKGKTLTVFGQEIGTGELICVGGENGAGIGGDSGKSCGKVAIFGGKIQAQGGKYGAGIGGGEYNGAGGTVTIGGGKVVARGGEEGAGIGSGYFSDPICNGGTLDVLGGDVEAYGGKKAAGIGGGYCCNGAAVRVRGGTVWAVGGEGPASGIGGGYYHSDNHGSLTVSSNLTVRSGVKSDGMSIMVPDSKGVITINGMPYYSIKAKVPSDDDEVVPEIEWAYTIQNGEAIIVNGELSAISIYTVGDVVVPAVLGGCPVTKIGGNAFSKCSNLTSITIPEGVREIGEYAFSGCKNVRTIKIPGTVSRIGTYAFLNCQSLTSVEIPSGVVELEDRLFSNCYGLLSVSLPKGLKRIGKNVFDCCGLVNLEIPNGVESMGYMAFARTQFDEIVIPNSVTNMGWGTFYAANTRSVILSKNLHEISDNMFWNADGIEEVTLPSCVTNIGGSAFYSCDSLKIVRIVACAGCDETVLTGLKMMLKDSGVDLDKVEIVVVGVCAASTFYVDSAKGRDSYSGLSADDAKKTIQAAIDVAQDGDTILVAAGTYAPFASKNKSVVIQSASGAAATFIDGTDALRPRVEMLDDTDSTFISVNNKTNTVLVGFTVEYCELIIGGTIQRCVIRNIDASAGGAPINFSIVDNSLILNNVGCNGGAGDNCIFRNCTIVGNRATAGYRCAALNCVLENCIVYGNADNSSGTWQQWLRPMISDVGYREATVFRDNPLFVNAEGADYRLSKNSPCIDAGDNAYVTSETDLNGLDRVVNGRVDIGCCEYQHPIVEDGLVAWYKFNGNARDSSGNANDGVVYGAQLTADRAGNADGAYLFEGTDWIQIDSSVSLNSVQDTDEMSFAAWLRIDSYDTWVPIFCKATGADGDPLYDFKYTFGRYFEGCDADLIDLNSVPKVGDWAHVAVTINHGEIVIYQNGNEVGRGSGGAFNSTIPNDALCIGMDSVTYKEFLRGAMDDVRFYNRALTESEVRALYDGNPVVVTHLLEVVSQDGSATTNVVPNGAIVRMIAPDNIVDMDGRRQIAALGSSFTAPIVTDHFDVLVTNDMTVAWDILSTNFFFEVLEPINGTISAPTNGWKRSGCVCEATAMPEDHYHFTRWVGDIDGAVFDDLHIEMIMDRPRAIGAEFAINTYTVSFELGDKGRFTVESRRKHLQSQTVSAGSGAIEPGVEPFYGWFFVGWDKNFSCVKDNMVVNAVWRDIRLKETIDGVTWIYTVDDGVAKIENNGENAVLDCTGETVAVPTSLGGHPVVGIGTGAFDGCNSLAHITIPRHIKSIGDGAFKNCGNLSLVFFEDADCELGRNVFSGCGQLREMQIKSDKLLKVSSQSLAGLDGVTICVQSLSAGFTIPVGHASGGSWAGANNVNWCVGPCIESGVAYFVGSIYSNRVGSVVTYPGAGPFGSIYRMTPLANLSKIDIPSTIAGIGVAGIGSDACDGCESIHEIGVPKNVQSIGTGAFRHCENLMSFTVDEDNEYYFAMDGLLYAHRSPAAPVGPALICCPQRREDVVLPNGVVSIGCQAFQDCKKIIALHFPGSVWAIEERAFEGCVSLEELSFSSSKKHWLRIGRTLFGMDWRVLRDLKLRRIEFASIVPPEIASDAFRDVEGVEINVSAFAEGYPIGSSTWAGARDVSWNVVGLSSPGIDYFETLDGVITNAVIDYAMLPERIEIPERCLDVVTSSISSNVFKGAFLDWRDDRRFGAERLVSIPEGVTNIGAYAFANCSGLVGVEIKSATCNIDMKAFDESYNITSLMIPSYLIIDGNPSRILTLQQLFRARNVYRNITNLVIAAGSTRIASGMFAGCDKVTTIFLSKEIEEIGAYAFSGCALKTVKVEFGDVDRVKKLLSDSGFNVDGVVFEETMTAKGLKDVFGDTSALSQHIKTEQDAEAIGDFLVKCGVKSADSLTDAQKRWSYESYVLSSITAAPQLFEEEPTLKIEDIELSGGNLSLTISLTVGTEKITLVKERLAEKIRVGSTLGSISEKPDIRAYPSADGTSLTFTIIPPSGSQGFVRVQID